MNSDTATARFTDSSARISRVQTSAFSIPTATPESDGTLEWKATVLVLVEIDAAGKTGIGFSYADMATATLIREILAGIVTGRDALATGDCWNAMGAAIRNLGRAARYRRCLAHETRPFQWINRS